MRLSTLWIQATHWRCVLCANVLLAVDPSNNEPERQWVFADGMVDSPLGPAGATSDVVRCRQ